MEILLYFILVLVFYPLLVLLIWTLIHRKDQRDYFGCPEIYTIGDLIDACFWRSRNTHVGDMLTTPIVGFFISLIITIFSIVLVVCKIFRWIFSLFRVDIIKIFSWVDNIISDLWDNFRNIKLFKASK